MEVETSQRIDQITVRRTIPGYAWVILVVTMITGISAPFSQFKVPPVMPVLMEAFRIDLTSAGMLMSIFAITGLIVALPAGLILQRFGLRISGLVAGGCLLAGSILGATAAGYEWLFASRLIEGIGMGLIAVVGPSAISAWFPADRRGLPMGIWATWVSLGSLLIYTIAPPIEAAFAWRSVWWMAAALTGAAMLLYAIFFRMPTGVLIEEPVKNSMAGMRKAISQPGIWLLAAAFGCFNFAIIGVIATYYPTYLTVVHGYDLTGASLVTGIKMIVVIATAPLIGLMVDRIGSPRRIILYSFVALAGFMALPFSITGWMIPVSMLLLGILAGAIPTCIFTSVPDVVGKAAPAGIGMGVIMVGQNVGQLLGPLVFGWMVQSVGWTMAGICTIPVLLIGFMAVNRIKMK